MQTRNKTACWELIQYGTATTGDAEVAGIGVIIAFIFSAAATLLATLSAYAFGLVDEGLLRPVDRLILRVPSRASQYLRSHMALRKAVLTLSDQQIVTGIAILAAGFNGLRAGTISVYHFQIVVYLAWMSSSVHLSALTLLRPFLHYHQGVMWWRVLGMLVLLVMLLVALVPTVSNDWDIVSVYIDQSGHPHNEPGKSAFGVPAICFWGAMKGDGNNPDSALSFVVIIVSYIWKLGGMFMPVRTRFECWFRNPVDTYLEKMLVWAARRYEQHGGLVWLGYFRLCLAIYLPLTASLETLGSFAAALWLSLLGFIYGVMQILIPRSIVQKIDPTIADSEDDFGFGQLVPLILLVQPLGAIAEHIGLIEGTEDEALYTDRGSSDPYSAAMASMRYDSHSGHLSEQPLIQFMAAYRPPPRRELAPQRIQLKAMLYTSKLFHLLVWMCHAGVAATAVVVFLADYVAIGYTTTGNWFFIGVGVVAWLGATLLAVTLLMPWSRLGRYDKANTRRQSMAVVELQTHGTETEEDFRKRESSLSSAEAATRQQTSDLHIQTHSADVNDHSATVTPTAHSDGGRHSEVWASEWRRSSSHFSPPQSPKSPRSPL